MDEKGRVFLERKTTQQGNQDGKAQQYSEAPRLSQGNYGKAGGKLNHGGS